MLVPIAIGRILDEDDTHYSVLNTHYSAQDTRFQVPKFSPASGGKGWPEAGNISNSTMIYKGRGGGNDAGCWMLDAR